MVEQVLEVAFAAREKIVQTDHFVAVRQESIA
jgi:hypothetical protein